MRYDGEKDTFAVQEQNDILTKCFIARAIQGENLDDFVCNIGGRQLFGPWIVC